MKITTRALRVNVTNSYKLRLLHEKVSGLLLDPSRWIKNTLATDEDGQGVAATSAEAAAWCLSGAAQRGAAELAEENEISADEITSIQEQYEEALTAAIAKQTGNEVSVPGFNDATDTTFTAVRCALGHVDKAIAKNQELAVAA